MFQKFHPLVNFIYFVLILGFSMFAMQPVILGLSLLGAICFRMIVCGQKLHIRNVGIYILIFIISACVNPLFSHQGVSILFYFPSGNPCTLESILYGLMAGGMLISMMIWFTNFNNIMTSDRIICLFSRMLPALSLIFSMVLRFVPRFRKQLNHVVEAQKGAGIYESVMSKRKKLKQGMHILSAITTWSLENSVDTADSMRARGYGTGHRSNYSIFKFGKRDGYFLFASFFMTCFIIAGFSLHKVYFTFFPYISYNETSIMSFMIYIMYSILVILPVMLELGDKWRWLYLKRNI